MEETDPDASRLARRLAGGDGGAFREVYDSWGGLVYGYCKRRLDNAADAEDVTQQVFVAAWRSRERFDPEPTATTSSG